MKRILFYTSNGVGLGHLRRSQLIAEELKSKDKNLEIILATSAVAPRILGKFFNHLICLNSLSDESKKISAIRLNNGRKLLQAVKKFKPDIIVSDFLLSSTFFSFYPIKHVLDNLMIKNVFIWRLRDYKNASSDLEKESEKLNCFTKIILPHSLTELKDLTSSSFLRKINNNPRFTISGQISRKINKNKTDDFRLKYKILPQDFLITITLGGGGELKMGGNESPGKIIKSFLTVYSSLIKIIPNLKVIIVPGPYLDNFEKKFMPGIKFVKFERNLPELMRISKLVISAAGYNTCNELIKARTPSILIPLLRGGGSDEQFERARYFQRKGISLAIKSLSGKELLKSIVDCKNNLNKMKKNFRNFTGYDSGGDKTADIILDLIK